MNSSTWGKDGQIVCYNLRMQEFITKKERNIIIREPKEADVEKVMNFFNKLLEEDTYILRYGTKVSLEGESNWLQSVLRKINRKEIVFLQAYFQDQLVGQVEITKGQYRKRFTGTLHLGVDRDFRGEGIGEELMKQAEKKAKELNIKLINLAVYDGNNPAFSLYKKMGYEVFGQLPKAIEFRGQMIDEINMYKNLS